MFEGGQDSIPLRQQEVPLAVELADQDHVPVGDLQSTWRIRLSSPTDPDVTTFTPETLVLSPGRPVGRSVLHLKGAPAANEDRKSTRLNSSHLVISYAVFCLKKKKKIYKH